jgi:cob(I)alamin adenosyltransferase
MRKDEKHKTSMEKQKTSVDASIAAADTEKSVVLLLTGNGKGKTSSAFGMVMRAMGYEQRVGIVQFIKGQQLSGEELFCRSALPEGDFYQMGTGFTWDTQDRQADIKAAERTWHEASRMLSDPIYELVILDELTYMLSFGYLDEAAVLEAVKCRPDHQSVVITGRGGGTGLQDLADTVSEVKEIKHAFRAGVKARRGVDY